MENHFVVLCDHDIDIRPFPKFPPYRFHKLKEVRADLSIPRGNEDSRLSNEIIEIVKKKQKELPEYALLHVIVSRECLYRLSPLASVMAFAPDVKMKGTKARRRLVYNNRFFDYGSTYLSGSFIELIPLYESSIDELDGAST